MFSHKHYVPILKAKEGEYKALQDTYPATKDSMTPLLEIVDVPWNYPEETEAKSIEEHLGRTGKKILEAWGNERKIFVDSNLIDGDRRMANGLHHLEALFIDFRANGLNVVPVTGLERQADYKAAVSAIVNLDNRGICLRLENTDFTPQLTQSINDDLVSYGLSPADVDLIIDLGSINGSPLELLALTASTLINSALPYLNDWRTLTVSTSAFPPNLSEIDANTIDTIDRNDWLFWLNLINRPLQRIPAFSDYSIAHPDMLDLDPRMITTSASIRYTADDYWLIVRGRGTKRFGFGQFHNLCTNLIRRLEYSGATFCWGDNYINDCAAQTVGTGNLTTWRRVANNHHFQKVVFQISSLL